jgi:hypothetical protein
MDPIIDDKYVLCKKAEVLQLRQRLVTTEGNLNAPTLCVNAILMRTGAMITEVDSMLADSIKFSDAEPAMSLKRSRSRSASPTRSWQGSGRRQKSMGADLNQTLVLAGGENNRTNSITNSNIVSDSVIIIDDDDNNNNYNNKLNNNNNNNNNNNSNDGSVDSQVEFHLPPCCDGCEGPTSAVMQGMVWITTNGIDGHYYCTNHDNQQQYDDDHLALAMKFCDLGGIWKTTSFPVCEYTRSKSSAEKKVSYYVFVVE